MTKTVDMNKYRPRIIDGKIEEYLGLFGAIALKGPRWCGKSWTASYHSNSEYILQNPANNFNALHLAEIDPGIVLDGETPRLIDEWQDVPPIWDAVRYEVDRRAKSGQFILTGSASPKNIETRHSGIGRIADLRMRTMSLYEMGDSSGLVSLKELCDGKLASFYTDERMSLEKLAFFLIRGGWPETLDKTANVGEISLNYIAKVVDEDVSGISDKKISNKKMELLLHSLARNETTISSVNLLYKDISDNGGKMDLESIPRYLEILDRCFLTENILPYSPKMRSAVRVSQSEKKHFCDVSLACALLNATPAKLIDDLPTFGLLFESLCEHDLRIYAESFGGKIYHYRDYKGREIDAVIEMPDGRWCAFEIKLGTNQIQAASENLVNISRALKKEGTPPPSVMCVISGLSVGAYQEKNGVFVVPITALKP